MSRGPYKSDFKTNHFNNHLGERVNESLIYPYIYRSIYQSVSQIIDDDDATLKSVAVAPLYGPPDKHANRTPKTVMSADYRMELSLA